LPGLEWRHANSNCRPGGAGASASASCPLQALLTTVFPMRFQVPPTRAPSHSTGTTGIMITGTGSLSVQRGGPGPHWHWHQRQLIPGGTSPLTPPGRGPSIQVWTLAPATADGDPAVGYRRDRPGPASRSLAGRVRVRPTWTPARNAHLHRLACRPGVHCASARANQCHWQAGTHRLRLAPPSHDDDDGNHQGGYNASPCCRSHTSNDPASKGKQGGSTA
jgi:hypothetical protein